MERKIILSKTARIKLEHLLNYLVENWSQKIKREFIQKLDKSFQIISKNPEIYPKSDLGNDVRKCVVSKQTLLIYKFSKTDITILTFFDSRQNPSKLDYDIKQEF